VRLKLYKKIRNFRLKAKHKVPYKKIFQFNFLTVQMLVSFSKI